MIHTLTLDVVCLGLFIISAGLLGECRSSQGDYGRLISHLLDGYDPMARPVQSANTTTTVDVFPYLKQVISLDIRSQTLTVKVNFKMSWIDEFLSWNKSDFGGISYVELPGTAVWRPAVLVSNSINLENSHYGIDRDTTLIVKPSGEVLWSPLSMLETTCSVNVAEYPFDNQTCKINIAYYWMYAEEVYIRVPPTFYSRTRYSPGKEFTESSEWKLENFVCYNNHKRRHKWWLEKEVTINSIVCKVYLQRRALFYIYNLVIPCLLLQAIGIVSFSLPVESDRISLAVTLLLSMMVFLMVIMESMPPTSTVIPLIEIFIGGCVLCLTISTAIAIVLAHFNSKSTRPPKWIRCIIYGKFCQIICFPKYKQKGRLKTENCQPKKVIAMSQDTIHNRNDIDHLVGDTESPNNSAHHYFQMNHVHEENTETLAKSEWKVAIILIDRTCCVIYVLLIGIVTGHLFWHL